MKNIISVIQLVTSVALITLIVLQAKGVGLGRAWGGGNEFYKSRRGVEKIIFQATVILVAIFLVSSVITLLFS